MRRLVALAALGLVAAIASRAEAEHQAVLTPTLAGDANNLHPLGSDDGDLRAVAHAIDGALADTAQDLELTLAVGRSSLDGSAAETALAARAKELGAILILPSVRLDAGRVVVRLEVVEASGAIHVKSAITTRADASVRAVVLLRDLVRGLRNVTERAPINPGKTAVALAPAPPSPSSSGRATLLVNATLFGGLLGFSVQKASGSSDLRLLFPLLLTGAGVGLGATMLITEEWDFDSAEAWYLASGMWWPTLAGQLIYAGRFADLPEGDRWEFGLIGGTAGIALASLGLTLRPMNEGGAWLAHSGGAVGVGIGSLVELAGRGNLHTMPLAGMGYGAGLGWLAAASAATMTRFAPVRVLSFDVGATVGGLAGAALASPLVVKSQSEGRERAFLGIIGGTAIVGAGTGVFLSRNNKASAAPASAWLVPSANVLGESALGTRRAPIVGLAWSGALDASCKPLSSF